MKLSVPHSTGFISPSFTQIRRLSWLPFFSKTASAEVTTSVPVHGAQPAIARTEAPTADGVRASADPAALQRRREQVLAPRSVVLQQRPPERRDLVPSSAAAGGPPPVRPVRQKKALAVPTPSGDNAPALLRAEQMAQAMQEAVRQLRPPTLKGARGSSVRYTTDVREGQHRYTIELLRVVKANKDPRLPLDEAVRRQCSFLSAREQLDLLRMIDSQHQAVRRHHRHVSPLPTYLCPLVGKMTFYKAEDLTEHSCLGRGPGGQATNRRMQTCVLKHVPSGIVVRVSKFPSLMANRKAARAALNLRLEKHLAGPLSLLAKREAKREKMQSTQRLQRSRLERVGERLARRQRHHHAVQDFLCGGGSLPDFARPAGDAVDPKERLTARLLLDKYAGDWWRLLSTSFCMHRQAPPLIRVSAAATSSPCSVRYVKRVCGWVIGATRSVPCWFCYVFPVVSVVPPPLQKPDFESMVSERIQARAALPAPPLEASSVLSDETALVTRSVQLERASEERDKILRALTARFIDDHRRIEQVRAGVLEHRQQVQACSASEVAGCNVRDALSCVLEAFGLFMDRTDGPAVRTDGLNWRLNRHRLVDADGELTWLAAAVFPHMVVSLRQLGRNHDADAIVAFFSSQTAQDEWAAEMLRSIAAAAASDRINSAEVHASSQL